MTKRLKIAVDCDDVLVNTCKIQIDYYNKTFNEQLLPEYFYTWPHRTWGTSSKALAANRICESFKAPQFKYAVPRSDAVKAVHSLAKNHDLYVITGRPESISEDTNTLIYRHFTHCFKAIEYTNFVDNAKNRCKKRSKAEVCRQLGIDVFIDDCAIHCKEVAAAGTKHVFIFGNYDWNKDNDTQNGLTRCNNWNEMLIKIQHIQYG